jgi:hypothetical protein
MDRNTKEMMQIAKICHGELGRQRCNDGSEEWGGVGSEDYVVHI